MAHDPWKRRRLGILCALLMALGGACAPAPEFPSCPDCNVVLVLADTLRADHLGAYGYERPTSPSFDELASRSVLFEQARSQSSCTFPSVNSLLTSRPIFDFHDAQTRPGIPEQIPSLPELLRRQGYSTAAVSASPIVRRTPGRHNPKGGFGRGFDHFDESCEWHAASCVSGRADRFLAQLEEPFFLYLHYIDPHDPYRAPEALAGRFATSYEGELDYIGRGDPNPIRPLIRSGQASSTLDQLDLQHLKDRYDEEILSFDAGLASLLQHLARRGLDERTLVVVASDHGESFFEHGGIKHCRAVYDNEVRVPLLLHLPGQRAGARRLSPVQNLDLLPTLLDYLELSEIDAAGFAGRSLRPVVESAEPQPGLAFSAMGPYRSVNDQRFKLVLHLGKERYQLFDVLTDPGEQSDLLRRERRAFAALRAALEEQRRRVEPGADLEQRLERAEELEESLRAVGYLG